jgi:hypothetical protein
MSHGTHPSVPNKQECKFLQMSLWSPVHRHASSGEKETGTVDYPCEQRSFRWWMSPSFGAGEFRPPCLFLNDLIASIYENRPGGSGCHQCLPQAAGVAEKIYCKLKWSPWAPHRWIHGVAEGIRLAKDWGVPRKVGRPRSLHHLCFADLQEII